MLKIQFKDKHRDPIWVVEKRYTIGSAPDNHLVIDDNSVSSLHARLITQDNKLFLKDNNSANGCFVNDQRVTQKQLLPGDEIRIGNVSLDILDPRESITQAALTDEQITANAKWALVADSSWLAGQEFLIPGKPAIIGRGSQCDITLPGTHLSRQHAEITIKGKNLLVKDLASANGTYINDERVSEGLASPGDRLRFDVYSFRLIGPDNDPNRTRVRRPRKANLTPVERKTVEDTPKQWKTRPTSPGNRIEPEKSTGSKIIAAFSLLLGLTVIAMVLYILLGAK
jgi:pSer/pThr/pTyr-binding forkhead associated (FHA) protein